MPTDEEKVKALLDDRPRFIHVKAHPDLGSRMALWDRDHRHPRDAGHQTVMLDDREFVDVTIDGANPVPVKVALTEAVQSALAPAAAGLKPKLVLVDDAEAEKQIKAHEKAVAARDTARQQAAAANVAPVPANPNAAQVRAANDRAAAAEAELEKLRAEIAKGQTPAT